MKRWRSSQEGQSLVLVVLMLTVFLGVLALAIDGGYAYAQRRQMQNAADAAAMAGAYRLAMAGVDQVGPAVADYALSNGADSYSWAVINDDRTVRVTTSVTFNTFFAGLLGFPAMTVSATAEASVGVLAAAADLLPMAIEEQEFEVGQEYTLWDNRTNLPGGFGWVDWNGVPVGNPELADNICNPSNSGVWSIGDWIPSGPGVQNSAPVRQCLNTWIGRKITIPVYDQTEGRGANGRYHIAGFARFVLTGYRFTGSRKWVRGRFVAAVVPGIIGQGEVESYQVRTIDLTR